MEEFREIWTIIVLSVGVVAGLFLTAAAVYMDAKARKVGNLVRLTEHHRKLWERFYAQPELARVLEKHPDLESAPVTPHEQKFVSLLIIHLSTTYYGLSVGLFKRLEGLKRDIRSFFSYPIPRTVWDKVKDLQDEEFARFVDECLRQD